MARKRTDLCKCTECTVDRIMSAVKSVRRHNLTWSIYNSRWDCNVEFATESEAKAYVGHCLSQDEDVWVEVDTLVGWKKVKGVYRA